jgi:hypothetical protein
MQSSPRSIINLYSKYDNCFTSKCISVLRPANDEKHVLNELFTVNIDNHYAFTCRLVEKYFLLPGRISHGVSYIATGLAKDECLEMLKEQYTDIDLEKRGLHYLILLVH